MKINEIIILENDAELRQRLEQEFDDEYGDSSGNKLPQFIMLDKASVVALAVGYIKRPKWSPGMALKYAVKQLYPNFTVTFSGMDDRQQSNFKKAKPDQDADKDGREDRLQKKAAPAKDPKPKASSNGTVGGQIGNQNARKDFSGDGGGTIGNIAKKINPLTGIDTTDLGTTVASAAAKAKSRMKNLDKFRVGK
tara:strand:+ start:573 stop:1154 length:582 start_codon:yes stop_codon:yes gene_type:complete